MFNSETIFLGLALAIDAAVVTFAIALLHPSDKWSMKFSRALISSLIFGTFQFLMLWLGSYGGFVFSFSNYGHFYPLLIAGIFLTLSSKFFLDSFKTIHREIIWGILPLLALGLATSIDALASGLSLGTLPLTHLIALDIGLITFLLCLLFYGVAQIFKNIPEKWLLRLAGVIFLGLGLNIILVEFFKDIL